MPTDIPAILPSHVVIIPDGNRRWAKERKLLPFQGHTEGYARANELITEAKRLGIEYLTLWAFSTENWNRSEDEVRQLLLLIERGLKELQTKIKGERARFVHLGRKDRLGENITRLIEKLEEETKENNELTLCLAIDYGGEDEVTRALTLLGESSNPSSTLFDFLDTTINKIPSPDLIIRTSGEQRTSGFMPLQSLYSEWHFDSLHFPDFDIPAFHRALSSYSSRERRFGK